MNGKNRRTTGLWSRGTPRPGRVKPLQILDYKLPVFSNILKTLATKDQMLLMEYFENYSFKKRKETFNFNRNTPYCIIGLNKNHFKNGTVRIRVPGIYVLEEDIVFNPNEDNDFMPTNQQIQSGLYPTGKNGAYTLGFFAAIAIETKGGVILDLNGKSIVQSNLHNIQQRFYSHIEIAGAPFIPKQGPAEFSSESTFVTADNVFIRNGVLGQSSHHGIHGNQMKNIIIQSLNIQNFEVAGIALNGAYNSIVDNVFVGNSKRTVRVLSSYSQARFIRKFMQQVLDTKIEPTLKNIPGNVILDNLNNALEFSKQMFMSNTTPNNIFGNKSPNDGYDGNVYGIVLNVNGVVINDFLQSRPADALFNQNILLSNFRIENLVSKPIEITALNVENPTEGAYSGKRQVGPAGDVFDILTVKNDDETYKKNVLSDSQLLIAKYNNPKIGTTNIKDKIVSWSEDGTILDDILDTNDYFVHGGDSMGHFMKGNIGLFISGGENIKLYNYTIKDIENRGNEFISIASQHPSHPAGEYPGGNSYGIANVASTNVAGINEENISNISSTFTNTLATKVFTI